MRKNIRIELSLYKFIGGTIFALNKVIRYYYKKSISGL